MCLYCICCCSTNCCVIITAILTAIQALLFASLNLCLMLVYQCTIQPPQEENLVVGSQFIENCWSWFFYDEYNCQQKQGLAYKSPPWIIDTPDYFVNSSVVKEVTPYANYCYQIVYFILHTIWFFAALILLYGNIKKTWRYFLPWIIIAILITFMDTLTGAFYIKLMDDTQPEWTDGQAIFSMQFLYFRTFFLYFYNILAIFSISLTCFSAYRKRNRLEKLVQKLNQNQKDIVVKKGVVTTILENSSSTNTSISTSTSTSFYNEVPVQVYAQMHTIEDYQPFKDEERPSSIYHSIESIGIGNATARRYRPFSYTNPSYRPTDPHDLEGMKTHATGLFRETNFYVGQTGSQSNPFQRIERIPRASLKK